MCFLRNGSLYNFETSVPLWSACLKTSGYALEFGPPNTKESDVLFQNVFSQKWIIIQLWNQYHCDQHAWKPQGTLEFGPPNTKESDVLFQNVFFQKWIIVYSFETCTIVIGMPGNLRVCTWVWPSKYKGKWCFIPKCVFSEMDHHTALKLVPL